MADTKNNKNSNSPALRFPGFTDEWKKCFISQFGDIITGNTPSTSQPENYTDEGYLWVSPSDLNVTKYVYDTKTHLSEIGFQKTRIIPQNSILVTCIGSTIGKMGMASTVMSTNQQINSIIANSSFDKDFVYYAIQSRFPKYLSSIAVQAVPILSKSTFGELENYYPSIIEQKRIGELLSLLDERIATQRRLIDKLETLIKGLREQLFRPLLYNCAKLKSIAQVTNGSGDVQDAICKYQEGLYPFFDRSDEVKFFKGYSFDEEAIIYAGEGAEFFPRYYNGKFALHQRCYAITKFTSDWLPRYIYHYLQTQNNYFIRNAVGSTVPSLRMDCFLEIDIPIAKKEFQEDISKKLDTLLAKIDNEKMLLSLYKRQKAFMVQSLFI